MAKKKTKKSKNKNKFEYNNEVIGVLIILVGIIGLLGTGIIGNMVKSFAIFLVGTIYILLLLLLLVVGVFLIFKKDTPNLLSSRFIGGYVTVISFLVLLHVKYIEVNNQEGFKIITETFNNLMVSFSSNHALSNSGGGIIGAIFSYLFVSAFGTSAKIIVYITFVLGIVLMLNVSILDLYNKIKPYIVKLFVKEVDDEEEEDNDKIKSNVSVNNGDDTERLITDPAVVPETVKVESLDQDVPIVKSPPKIISNEPEPVSDEVVISRAFGVWGGGHYAGR